MEPYAIGLALNIGLTASHSKIHGPGTRFVIWVQGCSIHCPGCANTDLWEFNQGKLRTISDLMQEIQSIEGIEGITITGGEPLDQAKAVGKLISRCKATGLTAVLYSGYEPDEIAEDPEKQNAMDLADIVILGRFQKENQSSFLRWRGSSNKEFIFHNEEYKHQLDQLGNNINEVEIHIYEDGSIIIAGYPDEDLRRLFKNATNLPG
jgi:anaerobic ribonucleoside-triphosphate reductase activating protein